MMIKDRVPQKSFMGEPVPQNKSTVLLVCIKTEYPQEITIEYLLGKFDSFGKINKILIFERAKIIKAFVEFATPTSAQEALVGSSVLRDFRHRIKCYPSNHEGILLTNDNNICAKDFTGKKPGELPQLTIFKDGVLPMNNLNPTSSHTLSTSDSPLETQNTASHACEQVRRLGERDAADEELERTLKFLESNESLMAKNNHSSLRSRVAELDEANAFFEQQSMMEKAKSFEIVDDDKEIHPLAGGAGYRCFYPSNSLPTNLAFEEKQSNVLTISGLNTATTSITNIYNLFSNFGNIFTILYFRGDNSALVEFDTEMSSGVSKMLLNNIAFFGSPIKINYTNPDNLKQKLANFNPTPDELFIGSPKTHRFRGDRPLSINPPSDTLHVSNLVREACSEGLIALFAPFGNIEAFKFLHEEPIKHMCLIRFTSTKSAIDALAALHNCTLLRRNVQISFTRSKI